MNDWFAAHKDGLRQIAERLVERRGFGIICGELYQNVRDTNATECNITLEMVPGRPQARLSCEDNDPTGFVDLSHAWTMYAPSAKKADPTKAGRFNVGEKHVLSFCRQANVHTTSGMVAFDDEGRHVFPRRKRNCGTLFDAIIDCTRERYDEFDKYVRQIIVRPGLTLQFNGEVVGLKRKPIRTFEIALRTEIGDNLRQSVRKTEVEVYEVLKGETPTLYELGIPVVETGDKFHVNVLQKVPLNQDRDNVTPTYLKSVRVAVLNAMFDYITPEDTTATWVNEAADDPNCKKDAVEVFMKQKYGDKRVALDPTNPDANAAALTSGYTLIPSRGLTPGQRYNAYVHELLNTSSEEFPREGKGAYSSEGEPVPVVPESEYSEGMQAIVKYTHWIAKHVLHKSIFVRIVECTSFVGKPWGACYGNSQFDYNLSRLGKKWFAHGVTKAVDKLLIHELAHEYASCHALDAFHEGCCDIGAEMKWLALEQPDEFERFQRGDI
jgi:hypothetical protein